MSETSVQKFKNAAFPMIKIVGAAPCVVGENAVASAYQAGNVGGKMYSGLASKVTAGGNVASGRGSAARGKPGHPRNLKIAYWNESHVFLKWKSPETDGGSPVTKYSLEVLDGNWKKEKEVRTEMAFIKYVEGRVYHFRVLAVNEVGPGEPSNIISFTASNRREIAVNEVGPGEPSNVTASNRREIVVNEVGPGEPSNVTAPNRGEIAVNEVGPGEPSNIISFTAPNRSEIAVNEDKPQARNIAPFTVPNRKQIAVNAVGLREPSNTTPLTVPKYTEIVVDEVRLGESSNIIALTVPKDRKIAVKEVGPGEPSDIIPFTAPNRSEIAVNEVEPGEPCNITPFKFKGGPPRIHHASFETVEVKVGESFEFKRFVEAEPSATVAWKLDDHHIENGDRLEITYDNCFARIKIPECEVDDGGVYSITAINEYGQLEQNLFELVVDEGVKGVLKKVGIAAACTAGASAAILGGVALAVPAMGFTAGGVAAGSLAALYQSAFLGGAIASGSAFATLQSVGAAGLAVSTQAGIVGLSGATSVLSVFGKKKPKK